MAVKLALTIRIDLAKECAIELNKSYSNDDFFNDFDLIDQKENSPMTIEAKKHVWLEIGNICLS
jgi:hypothetical protein